MTKITKLERNSSDGKRALKECRVGTREERSANPAYVARDDDEASGSHGNKTLC